MPDKTFQFKNPVKWENSFQLDTNTGMITMLRSIYLPKEINQFEIDFIVEDPTHRQFGKDAVTAKVNIFDAKGLSIYDGLLMTSGLHRLWCFFVPPIFES